MNVECVDYKNITVTAIDVGGRSVNRHLMRHYYPTAAGIVFCVDSNDRIRIEDATYELDRLLREDQLSGVPLLVFANKQDLPDAMPMAEVTEKMGLHALKDRQWRIQTPSTVFLPLCMGWNVAP
jgi:ADP-ribosylation factor 1/2